MTGNKHPISRRNFLAGAAASSALLAGCTGDSGGSYPSEDMHYIVPFSQGGGTDTYARKVVPEIGNELDVSVAIENVPGAASLKGTGELLKSKSDGYTFGGFNPPVDADILPRPRAELGHHEPRPGGDVRPDAVRRLRSSGAQDRGDEGFGEAVPER